jgi:hypothetical protein
MSDDCGSKSKKRKTVFRYYDAFLEYGFHYVTNEDGIQKDVCLICQKVMSNNSMKHRNFKRHIHKMHGSEADKSIEYYKSLLPADVGENTENGSLNLVQIELPNCYSR